MADNTHQSDVSLAPHLEGTTEAVVTFYPQIWRNDRAITGDETETFTVPIEEAVGDDGELLEDNTDKSGVLAYHENAPERAQNWYGPFYVTIDEVR
jgi:hypothetical protein